MKHLKLFSTTQELSNIAPTNIPNPSVYNITENGKVLYFNGGIPVSFINNDDSFSGNVKINNAEIAINSTTSDNITMVKTTDNLLTIGDISPSISGSTYAIFQTSSGYDIVNPINVGDILSGINETVESMRTLYNDTANRMQKSTKTCGSSSFYFLLQPATAF